MTPTLLGRIQTRLIVVFTVGLLWTILITPFLPREGASLDDAYSLTLRALGVVGVLGALVWEPLYHLIQQFRWEKDWPTGLGLVTGIPEGLVTYAVLAGDGDVPGAAFSVHFFTTWMLIWFTVNGPLRIVALRWRYRGGRLL